MYTIVVKGLGSHKFTSPEEASKFLRKINLNGLGQPKGSGPTFGTTKDGRNVIVYGKRKSLKV